MSDYKPVVGEKCEFSQSNGIWESITPKFVGWSFCIADIAGVGEVSIAISHSTFRPIRTQEDIEREEAIEDIASILSENGEPTPYLKELCAKVIDAGYRLVGEEVSEDELFITVHDPLLGSDATNEIVTALLKHYDIYRKVMK